VGKGEVWSERCRRRDADASASFVSAPPKSYRLSSQESANTSRSATTVGVSLSAVSSLHSYEPFNASELVGTWFLTSRVTSMDARHMEMDPLELSPRTPTLCIQR